MQITLIKIATLRRLKTYSIYFLSPRFNHHDNIIKIEVL